MLSDTAGAVNDEIRKLRSELGHTRRQLEQREAALAALNRRLLVLERNQAGIDGTARDSTAGFEARISELTARCDSLTGENAALGEEIQRVYATKLFRIARPARRVYGLLRGM